MGSVVASSRAGSYLHTLSNEGSSGQMDLWSTWRSEPQTGGLRVNGTCKAKSCFAGKENKKIDPANEFGLLPSEDAQVARTTEELISICIVILCGWQYNHSGSSINIPVGHLINSLITPGHGGFLCGSLAIKDTGAVYSLPRQHCAVKHPQLCGLLWSEKRSVPQA